MLFPNLVQHSKIFFSFTHSPLASCSVSIIGSEGSREIGLNCLPPKKGQLGPGAQLSDPKKWTVGPQGSIANPKKTDNWAPDSWAEQLGPGAQLSGAQLSGA